MYTAPTSRISCTFARLHSLNGHTTAGNMLLGALLRIPGMVTGSTAGGGVSACSDCDGVWTAPLMPSPDTCKCAIYGRRKSCPQLAACNQLANFYHPPPTNEMDAKQALQDGYPCKQQLTLTWQKHAWKSCQNWAGSLPLRCLTSTEDSFWVSSRVTVLRSSTPCIARACMLCLLEPRFRSWQQR